MGWTAYIGEGNNLDSAINPPVACSLCFLDKGLQLDAASYEQTYADEHAICPNCGKQDGKKLPLDALSALAHRFFVWGSLVRTDYGGAPLIQFNKQQKTCIDVPPWLAADVTIFEKMLGVGFFYYGPRLWMVGEIEPLKALQDEDTQEEIIKRIVTEYPDIEYGMEKIFYSVRIAPSDACDPLEYDSPPAQFLGRGRLDSVDFPVLYGSPDIDTCVHECRVTAEDEMYVATLKPKRTLKLLNVAALLKEKERVTEFESLDIAVHMLFLAGKHSYEIIRKIAIAAKSAGFDGIIFPSYFSLVRLGVMPFQTTYGISHRRIESMQNHEESMAVPNLALFDRPIASGDIEVVCVNRLVMKHVHYGYQFGPAKS